MEEWTIEQLQNYILQHDGDEAFQYWVDEAQAILNDRNQTS